MKKNYARSLVLALSLLLIISSAAFAQTTAADPVGNETFQKNLEAYPGLWDAELGVTQPVFQFNDRISEQVFIEIPIDTDGDGQRDLLKAYIFRPGESGKNGVKVPVLLHHTPYLVGGMSTTNLNHVVEQKDDNPSTAHYTYNVIKTKQVQAYDWPWMDEAFQVQDAVYGTITVPAARGEKPNPDGVTGATITGAPTNPAVPTATSWRGYLIPRGYAYVVSGNLGTRYSQGIPSTCDIDEALGVMAVIKWFVGETRAYTSLDATVEVKATDWCSGNVAMEGTSYPGTTPLLAAGSGIKNLKAIFPKAGVSSWYNYYRDNGAVHNPDLYSGEDAVKHADFNFTGKNYITPEVRALADQKFASLLARGERDTGSYNEFWDQRNLLRNLDRLQKGRENDPIGVIIQHGFNDHNVRTRMSDQLYRAIKEKAPLAPVKIWWHTQVHTDAQVYGGLLEWTQKWLDHFLYGIDNNVVEEMPEATIVSNIDGSFEHFDSWPIPGSEYQRLYFRAAAEGSGAGTFALNPAVGNPKETFKDDLMDYTTGVNQVTGGRYQAYAAGWERRALLGWDGAKPNLNAENINRLAYVSEPLTENLRLNGVAKITLNLTPDKAKGNISAAIVEIGTNNRPLAYGDSSGTAITVGGKTYPALTTGSALTNGATKLLPTGGGTTNNVTTYLSYAMNSTMSEYKFVARAHANVRKPNPSGKIYTDAASTNFIPEYYYQEQDIVPGQAYSYTFEFEPQDYTFKAGQQIAVIVFSTDYRHSDIPSDVTTFSMDLSKSYIEIPFVNNTLNDIGLDLKLTIDKDEIKEGDYVNVAAELTKEVNGNVASLDFVYDKDLFEYRGYNLPDGVTFLLSEETAEGRRIMVMAQDYKLTKLASIMLSAKADITEETDGIVGVIASIVQKDEESNKKVLTLSSGIGYIPPIVIGEFDLITLSNAIDAFGKNTSSYDWNKVKQYDINNDGKINILDIVEIARKIQI